MAVRAITALVTGPAVLDPAAVPAPILDLRCSRLVRPSVLPALAPRILPAATARLLTAAPALGVPRTLQAHLAPIAAPLVAAILVAVAHPVIGNHGLVISSGVGNRWLLHYRITTQTP